MSQKFDVNPGSSPVEPEPETDPAEIVEPKPDGRTPDEVRGELLRKMEKSEERILAQLDRIAAQTSQPTPADTGQPPSTGNTDDALANYSVAQLEQYKANLLAGQDEVDPTQLAQFDNYVLTRRLEEMMDGKINSLTQSQQLAQEEARFANLAKSMYPDLENSTSEFSQEVAKRKGEMTSEQLAAFPKAHLHIANEVAIERDLKPQSRRIVQGTPRIATGGTAPADAPKAKTRMSDAQRQEIADSLRRKGALPRGKEFDMDRVKNREDFYADNIDDHIRR